MPSSAWKKNTSTEHDTVNVGIDAPRTFGDVTAINALLTVNGGGANDAMIQYDTVDNFNNNGTLTATSITGLGMAPTGSITYGTLETLKVNLGSGGDTFDIVSTLAGVTTTLSTNAGADTVNVQTNATALTVNTGTEDDTVNVFSSAGVTFVNTDTGKDTVNVQAIEAALTVNTGTEDDTVNVGSAAPGTLGNVNAINAPLTVNGDGGADTLNVYDTSDSAPNSGQLTATTLSGLGMGGSIGYSTLETLKVNLGSGGDSFDILSTHLGTTTTLNTNSGDDTVNVVSTADQTFVNTGDGGDFVNVLTIGGATTVYSGARDDTITVRTLAPSRGGTVKFICAALTIDAGTGIDVLTVDNTGDRHDRPGALTASSLTGLGMSGNITYGAVESLEIFLGSGVDTFSVSGTMRQP